MRGLRERLLAVPTGAVTPPPVFLLSVRSDAVHPNPVEVEDYRTVLLGLSALPIQPSYERVSCQATSKFYLPASVFYCPFSNLAKALRAEGATNL